MIYPKWVLEITKKFALKHGSDIELAVRSALEAAKERPEFKDLVETLVYNAVRELIYQARHESTVQAKNNAGFYGQPAKVKLGDSEVINQMYGDLYDNFYIAGTQLGLLKGEQLEGIATSEANIAQGHRFNSLLCLELRKLVPNGKSVKDAVPLKKLQGVFRKVKGLLDGGMSAAGD